MRWEDERYVKMYTRDTTTWLMWSWQARFTFMSLLRKVDRAGIIDVGEYGVRGLAVAIGVPIEIVEHGIAELIADKTVKQAGGMFVIPNFLVAQECSQSDKARQAAKRERDRAKAVGDESITNRDGADTNRDSDSQNVTESHGQSHGVTPSHTASLLAVPSLAVPCLDKTKENTPLPPVPGGGKRARKSRAVSADADVVELFNHWRAVMKIQHETVIDDLRNRRMRSAIDTYGMEACKRAIDGCYRDEFLMGRDERSTGKHNDVTLIFRDAAHIEKFIAQAPKPRAPEPAPKPPVVSASLEENLAAKARVPSMFGGANG